MSSSVIASVSDIVKRGSGGGSVRSLLVIFAAMQASLVLGPRGGPFAAAKCRFKHAQNDPIFLTTCEARCLNHEDKLPVGLTESKCLWGRYYKRGFKSGWYEKTGEFTIEQKVLNIRRLRRNRLLVFRLKSFVISALCDSEKDRSRHYGIRFVVLIKSLIKNLIYLIWEEILKTFFNR